MSFLDVGERRMSQSGDSNPGLRRFLASYGKEFRCEPIEFKVKVRLFSRQVSKKGKERAPHKQSGGL